MAIVAGVIVVGGVAWLGATWYTGKRIEAEAPARLKEVNDQMAQALPASYKVELRQVSYERGFFSTKARYGLVMSGPTAAGEKPFAIEPGMLEFDALVQHGPFPGGALAQGHLMPNAAFVHAELAQTEPLKQLYALTNGKTPLWSDTVVHYNGDSTGTGGLAAMKATQDGFTVEFSGAAMEASYKRENQAIKGTFKSDSLVASNPKDEQVDKVTISGVAMDLNTHMGKFGLSVGDTNMKVKRVELQGKAYPMSLDDLGYTLKMGEDDKLLNGEVTYSIGKFSLGTTDMGGGQAVVKLTNLEGKAAQKLAKTYSDLVNALMAESTGAQAAPNASEDLMKRVAADVRDLLAASPTLSIDPIQWKTDKGEARVTYSLVLQPLKDTDAPVQDMVRQAIKSMQAHAVVNKPMAQDLLARTLVATQGATPEDAASRANDEIQSSIGMAQMMNIVRADGDNIVADFVYDGTKATLNGQEIPLDALLADAVGAADDIQEPEMPDGLDTDKPPVAEGAMLHTLDPATLGSLVEAAGYEFETRTGEYGEPELGVAPGSSGARELVVRFSECDPDEACENVMLQAVYEAVTPPPYKAINSWNEGNRWARVYVDSDNRPTLEMDINAYGGIGRDGVEAFVQTFFDTVPQLGEAMRTAAKSKGK
ncbi:DUF945 family protein [Bordetella genomosp. 13]|uniref:DUF945 family protein n=1 Tax=Bordetella genomosp. 13 TaxID=463040 RepID=UPI001642FB6D|nr:DUF945 family protein [Bordetella genomosp. 13]